MSSSSCSFCRLVLNEGRWHDCNWKTTFRQVDYQGKRALSPGWNIVNTGCQSETLTLSNLTSTSQYWKDSENELFTHGKNFVRLFSNNTSFLFLKKHLHIRARSISVSFFSDVAYAMIKSLKSTNIGSHGRKQVNQKNVMCEDLKVTKHSFSPINSEKREVQPSATENSISDHLFSSFARFFNWNEIFVALAFLTTLVNKISRTATFF